MNQIKEIIRFYKTIPFRVSKQTEIKRVALGLITLSSGAAYYKLHYSSVKIQSTPPYKEIKALEDKWDKEGVPKENPADSMFQRAEELKKLCEKDYIVCIHGQSSALTPLGDLINLLQNENFPCYKHIRMSEQYSKEEIASCVQTAKNGFDDRENVKKMILSVDVFFQHRFPHQSAYSYVENNRSECLYDHDHVIADLASSVASKAGKDQKTALEIGSKIEKLCHEVGKNAVCGNLWVFCIPKTLSDASFSKMIYRSHTFGLECMCHEANERIILQKLQENRLDASTECYIPVSFVLEENGSTLNFLNPVPQFRLVIPELNPKEGILSMRITPFNKAQRMQIEERVVAIVESQVAKTSNN